VEPLITALGVREFQLFAMSASRFRDRRDGKQALVAKTIGEAGIRSALVVTDSLDDRDLSKQPSWRKKSSSILADDARNGCDEKGAAGFH
jgi:hypothetical protein